MVNFFKKRWFIILLFIIGIYIAHFAFLHFGNEYEELLTETISLNSKKDIFLLSLVYTVTRVLMIAAIFGTIYLMSCLLSNKYFFAIAGIFFIILGGFTIFVALKVISPDEMKEYIHIPILGGFIMLCSLAFFYAQIKKHKNGARDNTS